MNVDFAVSEHIGRWQIGAAGYYLRQFEDDIRNGVSVAPDGRRTEVLSLGGVINYDIPEHSAAIKFKVRSSVFAYNTAMVTAFISPSRESCTSEAQLSLRSIRTRVLPKKCPAEPGTSLF